MTPDNETTNGNTSLCIHIPWDVLNEDSPYKCPTAVNIQLSPRSSHGVKLGQPSNNSTRTRSHTQKTNDRKVCKGLTLSKCSGTTDIHMLSVRSCSMEGPEGRDTNTVTDFHDVIEMVAAANEHLNDFTDSSDLPELRASPCHLYYRNNQNHQLPQHRQQGQQLLYATNYHAGRSPSSSTSKPSGSSGQNESMETRIQMERSKLFQEDVKNGKNQTYSRPILPQTMPCKDYIKSWLQHGSRPNGNVHFPDVINHKSTKQTSATRNISNKKQPIVPPISSNGAKSKKLRQSNMN